LPVAAPEQTGIKPQYGSFFVETRPLIASNAPMPRKLRVEFPGAVYRVMSREEVAARRKGDPGKLAMAARLRRETMLSIKAIAERLHLGTSKSADMRLHAWMRNPPPKSQPAEVTP
jgi:hypothetical protein